VIVAALAFLGDRAMSIPSFSGGEQRWQLSSLCLLTLLRLVLLIFLNSRRKNKKGGEQNLDEQM